MAHSKDVVANLNNFKEKHGIKGIIFALVIVVLILAGSFFFLNRGYSGYKVLDSSTTGAGATARYRSYKGKVLRYSNDGITCLNDRYETIWSFGYSMQNPMLDICGDYIALGDLHGEEIILFDGKGLVKKIPVTYMLEDFRVSAIGGIFTVLADSDRRYLKYYDKEGETIADGMVQPGKTGYPLNFDVSDDGRLVAMSYLFVGNGQMKTNIAFYNFDSAGERAIDRIVSSYEYKDSVIPDVRFFGSDSIVAVGDKAAYVYSGKDKPALQKTIDYPGEPESLFFGDDKFGLVYSVEGEDGAYKAEIYKPGGSRLSAFNTEKLFDKICFSGDNVLGYNDEECRLYALSGNVRFNYTFEERVTYITPINGRDRFVLVTNEAESLISLN